MTLNPTPLADMSDVRKIGFRIRAARRRNKQTQAQIAARAGIDKGHLSRIERGEKSASVGTLHTLAVALGTSLSALLGEGNPKDEIRVVRAHPQTTRTENGAGAEVHHYETISSGGSGSQMTMVVMQVGTQAEREVAVHGGDEAIFVLEGSVRVCFGAHSVALDRHDSVSFPGYLPHSLCALGKDAARVLVIMAGEAR